MNVLVRVYVFIPTFTVVFSLWHYQQEEEEEEGGSTTKKAIWKSISLVLNLSVKKFFQCR